jgi:glycosyltransferase involved in cell wall biosynthesis
LKKISIIYNAYTLSKPITGVGRYTQLLSFFDDNFIYKIASIPNNKMFWSHNFNQIIISNFNNLFGKLYWTFFKNYNIINFDIFHSPYPNLPIFLTKPSIITVHDLIFLTNPEWYTYKERIFTKISFYLAIKKATKIICVSNTTLNCLIKFFPEVKSKSIVIYNSLPIKQIENSYKQNINNKLNDNKIFDFINSKYFVCPSNRHPRKNLKNTINAFNKSKFKNLGYKIVLTGVNEANDDIEHIESFLDLGYLNDNDYYYLLQHAEAILYFPLDEGFGLPILDSIMTNTPILCSNIPVFREIFENISDKIFCKKFDNEEGILEFLNTVNFQELDMKKFDFLKEKFSYKKFEEKHINLYNEVAKT